MAKIIPFLELKKIDISENDYVVYGGSFDPIHLGHLGVIQRLLKVFSLVVIAPCSENPWKDRLLTSLEQRIAMLEIVLQAEGIDPAAFSIDDGGYTYSEEVVHRQRKKRSGKLFWASGEDSAADVDKWRNWHKLDVIVISVSIELNLHSTEIRQREKEIHPALIEYIQKNKLYQPK